MNQLHFKKFVPGIAWFFIVLVLICMPGSAIIDPTDWFYRLNGDKIVHAFMFGMMNFLFAWPIVRSGWDFNKRRNYLIKICLSVIVWGLTTEFIQKFYVPTRSFELMDWGADSFGAMIALILMRRKL